MKRTGSLAIIVLLVLTAVTLFPMNVMAQGEESLASGESGIKFKAIDIGFEQVVGLTEDGRVFAWGNNEYGQCDVPEGLTGVVEITAGGGHVVAVKEDGGIVAWGRNDYGQCDVLRTYRRN